jgi:hypothetical protein
LLSFYITGITPNGLTLSTISKEQSANTGLSKANTSGVKGVSFLKGRNKWRASINLAGKKVNLGTFNTLQEAVTARQAGEKQ